MKTIKESLKINILNLDEENVDLPELYSDYTTETEIADDELKKAKFKFDVYEAELYLLIKRNPNQFHANAKPTEGEVKAIILQDEKIQKMRYEILEIEKQKKLNSSSVKSLEMKRDALKNLTSLHASSYFLIPGGVKTYKENMEVVDEVEKRKLRREMKRKLRRNNEQEKE